MLNGVLKQMSENLITIQKLIFSALTAFQNVEEKATVLISILTAT